ALMTDSPMPVSQGQTIFTVSNGSFSATGITFLPGGTYNIWGQYSGDGTNAASTSAKTQITVNPEASSTYFNIVDVATPQTGTVALNSGTTNVPYGTQLILSAEPVPTTYYNNCITASNPSSSACSVAYTFPTGTVAFADNGSTINTAVVNAEGDAEYNAPWTIGSHSVTAAYSGYGSYNKSTSSAITFSIAKATPGIFLNTALGASNGGSIVNGQSTAITILVENTSNSQNSST